MLIKVSFAGAFITMLAAVSSIGAPGFDWDRLPAVIGTAATCAGWISLVAYANRPKRKAPSAGRNREGACKKCDRGQYSIKYCRKEVRMKDKKIVTTERELQAASYLAGQFVAETEGGRNKEKYMEFAAKINGVLMALLGERAADRELKECMEAFAEARAQKGNHD